MKYLSRRWTHRVAALGLVTLSGGPLTVGWAAAMAASLGAVRETSAGWLLLYGWSCSLGVALLLAAYWVLQDEGKP